jgi:hypothetical protein
MKKYFFSLVLFLCFIHANYATVVNEFSFTVDSDNKILVFGEVNGNSGYYIIDTGVQNIILFDTIQNLPETELDYDVYWLLGEIFTSKRYITSHITLGSSIINSNFTIIQASENIKKYFTSEIKGIINICALSDIFVEFSFSKRKIYLHDSMPQGYTESMPYIKNGILNFIPISTNNREYLFLIDTGYVDTIGFPEAILGDYPQKDILKIEVGTESVSSNYSDYYKFKTSFILFNHTYTEVICSTSIFFDKMEHGVIGLGILKNYNLVFDPISKEIFYQALLPEFYYDIYCIREVISSGIINVNFSGNSLIINQIIFDSPAWKAGLRPGYKISKINSYNIDSIFIEYIQRTLQSNDRIKLTFFDESKNKSRSVWIKPKSLLK